MRSRRIPYTLSYGTNPVTVFSPRRPDRDDREGRHFTTNYLLYKRHARAPQYSRTNETLAVKMEEVPFSAALRNPNKLAEDIECQATAMYHPRLP